MSRWAVRHPVAALLAWLLVLVVAIVAGSAFGGTPQNTFALPGTPSQQAQDLLAELDAPSAKPTASLQVVWSPTRGRADDAAVKRAVMPTLKALAALPEVNCVATPFGENLGRDCAKALPPSLAKVVEQGISKVLAKETGLTLAQVQEATAAIAPIADIAPGRLGRIAAALPTAAKVASLPKPLLDGLIKASEWLAGVIPGIPKTDIAALDRALGGIQAFAKLPASVLKPLAKADPAKLRAIAERLPKDVAEIERVDREMEAEIAKLKKAADAFQASIAPVSKDGRVAYATATIEGTGLDAAQADAVAALIEQARTPDLQVGAQGAGIDNAGSGQDLSIPIGLLAALLILLVAFGSVTAALLPLIGAGTGLAIGAMITQLAMRGMDISSVAPSLAIMIGLGVGTDYALFVLNRFRQGLQSGMEPKPAAEKAVGTAGRAVLFAGTTVIVALLGMHILGIGFFDGLAVAAAATVLMVMLAATWFLPAVLSLLGTRALGLRLPWARTLRPFDPETSAWSRFGALLQRAPIVPVLIVVAIGVLLALPATRLQTGFPDDGSQAVGSVQRTGYDLIAEGFGAGRSAPFAVAVQVPKSGDVAALATAIRELERTPGIASTMPDSASLPLLELGGKALFPGRDGRLTAVIVYPTTGPASEETSAVLATLRDDTAPALKAKGIDIAIGGSQAVTTDFTEVVSEKLPLFLLFVVGFGFLALMVLFRSLLIPLTAALTSLLSYAAALGVAVAVFQLGIGDSLLQVPGTGPILPFLPLMVFAILFGLSMDYQVFLVSRMREEWEATGDNRHAVRIGLAGSGRVVVIAASIMTSVFLAFVLSPNATLKLFGVALGAAVLVDAFLVRLILVPALMTMLGRANWWLPRWLGRFLPTIRLE